MKKTLFLCISCLYLLSNWSVKADTVDNKDIYLRDDLIYILFTPLINKELEKHFGELKQYYCANIIQIKKTQQGSYFFDVTVQVTTFEGAHNPPNDLVTITFSNSDYKDWHVINFKSKRLKENQIDKCRQPL
ncbi:DUF3888 domain-containing protein [Psychrobacillus sp. L3]|uniref:DUF3888 domain-containing protein n=1 Tax=Psychrobacillus sp. L3 TaxID=3236891 RepID=UPI0036F32807